MNKIKENYHYSELNNYLDTSHDFGNQSFVGWENTSANNAGLKFCIRWRIY